MGNNFTPFPAAEELINKFLNGVNFSDTVEITYPRLPATGKFPHVTFFLFRQNYYTNMRNDLLGVNNANFVFSFWGTTVDQVVILSRECELALHDFPPFKIGWRILTNLKEGSGGGIDLGPLKQVTATLESGNDPLDELKSINSSLNTILSDENLESASNADEVKTEVNAILPFIENLGFTLRARNKLDILRPQQIESGYFERALEVEFLNGG